VEVSERQVKPLKNRSLIILILGVMTALSPFSIDMYLPAFQTIANQFGTTVAQVSLSVSSYFVGLAAGQLFYGPLLDRFGRKPPLYAGLAIYLLASILCLMAKNTDHLVMCRLLQAIGGCAAGVASMAMVRDLFSLKESAKVYSLLILILGTSPLLAPTIGGALIVNFGWHSVFYALSAYSILLLAAIKFLLPESHAADTSVALRAGPIAKGFFEILKNRQFLTYAFSGAIAFSGLFVYVAGSPIIFLETYKVSAGVYGWIFAIIAAGMILASQVNVFLLKRYSNQQLVTAATLGQVIISSVFVLGLVLHWFNLPETVAMFFLFMCSFGINNPNGGALALEPFSKNAGRASALLGFMQMSIGALASSLIGVFQVKETLPVVALIAVNSFIALLILLWGQSRLKDEI
jgi:DHA1 family bicyclomycin/chloramphenicol resistance-like MFS transporter